MNKPLRLLIYILLSFIGSVRANQDSVVVKYQGILAANIDAKSKVDSLIGFSVDNLYLNDSIAGLAMHKALAIAEKQGFNREKGLGLSLLSWREEKFGNIQKALQYGQRALEVLEAEPPGHTLIWTYNHVGHINRRLMESGKAMEYSMKALRVAEKTADTSNIGAAYSNIAALYVELAEYGKALQYHEQARHWRQLAKDELGVALSNGDMGIVYMRLKRYDEALAAHYKGLETVAKMKLPAHIAFFYNDIGSTYLYKGNTDSAIHYLCMSIAMREEIKETNEIAYTYNYLGEAYEKAGNITEGERWIRKSLQTAIDLRNSKQHYEALESLSDFFARNGMHDSAYVYLHKHKLYGDSINESRRVELIHQLATQYETEKKEQQIEILSQETAIQQLKLRQRGLLLIGSVVLLSSIALFIYFVQNRRKIRAEARLQRQAAQEVLQAEERERRRIARDLHDGVGQMLSASLLSLSQVQELTEGHSSARQMTERSLALLNESYDEMRSISHQMMPNALLKAGLGSSVREFVEKIDNPKLKVSLDVVGLDQRLDEQVETVLYRMIQEAVNNVVKHAEASKLSIQIIRDKGGIDLTIEDNGKGFDQTKMSGFNGIGLRNIQSRVALLNGTLEVDSAPGRGTLLAINVPNE